MLASIGFGEAVIGALIILISILLIGLVLLQKNRGSGLSGAFGGVGGHSAFGTKTGDFLTWFTVGLASLFLILCVAGNFVFEPATAPARPANATLIDAPEDTDDGSTDTAANGSTTGNSASTEGEGEPAAE